MPISSEIIVFICSFSFPSSIFPKNRMLFFSILMMAVLSVNYSLKEPRVNTLLLDNIEALAADEQDVPTNCWGSGSVDCPVTKVKVEYVATGYSLEK